MVEVQRRLAMQAHRLAVQGAICQLARVELRVLALLWHLAERWGRVGREGVVLPVKLTHETLGRFVGARRPSVTLAMGQLADDGLVTRRDDGAWVLPPRSQDVLAGLARRAAGRAGRLVLRAQAPAGAAGPCSIAPLTAASSALIR